MFYLRWEIVPFYVLFFIITGQTLIVAFNGVNLLTQIVGYIIPLILSFTVLSSLKKIPLAITSYVLLTLVLSVVNYASVTYLIFIIHVVVSVSFISLCVSTKQPYIIFESFYKIFSFAMYAFTIVFFINIRFQPSDMGFIRADTVGYSANSVARVYYIWCLLSSTMIICKGLFKTSKSKLVFDLLISLMIIALTFSKTVLIALVCLFLIYLVVSNTIFNAKTLKMVLIFFILTLVAITVTPLGDNVAVYLYDTKAQENLLTLSARSIIWAEIIADFQKAGLHKYIGYGGGSSVNVLKDIYIPGLVTHAHNAQLQTLVEYGVIGLIAQLYVIGYYIRIIINNIRTSIGDVKKFHIMMFVMVLAILIKGISEGSYSVLYSLDYFLLLLFFIFSTLMTSIDSEC